MSLREKEISFRTTPAKIGGRKHTNVIATANNISLWARYSKKKIKDTLKDHLIKWMVNNNEDDPYTYATVTFTPLRNNARSIDADAMAVSTYKWIIDTFVEQGYLNDDNKVTVVMKPCIVCVEDINETMVQVHARFYD